jgi:hypothetical protein
MSDHDDIVSLHMKTIIKIGITTLFGFSLFVLSGCGPKEKPLSLEEIKEAAKFFGGNINFTATQISSMHSPAAKKNTPEEKIMETAIAFSEGKRREAVMASPGSTAFITIFRPDRNTVYSIWPGDVNIVVEQVLRSPKAGETPAPNPIKEKSDIGEETINGHPCIKCKVITQEGGTIEWTTWEATDLNRFPIRAEYFDRGKIMRLEFTDVKLEKPDSSLFEPPKGCKKLKSKEEAFGYMMKMMKNAK